MLALFPVLLLRRRPSDGLAHALVVARRLVVHALATAAAVPDLPTPRAQRELLGGGLFHTAIGTALGFCFALALVHALTLVHRSDVLLGPLFDRTAAPSASAAAASATAAVSSIATWFQSVAPNVRSDDSTGAVWILRAGGE